MMMLYKRTLNKFTKEKASEGARQGDRIIQNDNGDISIIRPASDNWY